MLKQLCTRRTAIQGGLAGLLSTLGTAPNISWALAPSKLPGFESVPANLDDLIHIPKDYDYQVLNRWGDPVGDHRGMPAFKPDATNSAEEQALQAGMHHDGMHFFPFPGKAADHGLLVINHEYTDEWLLHAEPPGPTNNSLERVRKSQHAVGVSIIEVKRRGNRWTQILPSPYARRIHANTPIQIGGPARGAAAMRTLLDPEGVRVMGTLANCAMGVTPWGTYLTCEENFHGYFGGKINGGLQIDANHTRYGTLPGGQWVNWLEHDSRFDMNQHPNEANRFGWVVEIDPWDPSSTPIKRTALGRKRQESATCTLTSDGRVVVYMGDDSRFEYIYKFVSKDKVKPGGYKANAQLLDEGTLYAARFHADGRGEWMALVQGQGPLQADFGFATQADVLIKARLAAQAMQATPMDRPEWIAVHPETKEVFATLSNNVQRGQIGKPPTDAPNPRAVNRGGHILRWREAGADPGATQFKWEHFALAGDPKQPNSGTKYPQVDNDAFACPDGLHFDRNGLLWIQTDIPGQAMGQGAYKNLGANGIYCTNLQTGQIKRFLTGPKGSEITGCLLTEDARNMFVNIQHPGEASEDAQGKNTSHWPDGTQTPGARPRSATVVIRRKDGGVIGS